MDDVQSILAEALEPYLFSEGSSASATVRKQWALAVADHAMLALRKAGYVNFNPSGITRVEVIGDKVYSVWADECTALIEDGRLAIFPHGEGAAAQRDHAEKQLMKIAKRREDVELAVAALMKPRVS